MMERKVFVLAHPQARKNAARACLELPDGVMATFAQPKKKRIQEEKYHAMIADIADQTEYIGRKWNAESMKRILVDEFADEMREAGTPLTHNGELIPSQNGRRIIQLGIQTRDFRVGEASQFIEFLYAYGMERDVIWSQESAEGAQ